jgi:hypothetical protein
VVRRPLLAPALTKAPWGRGYERPHRQTPRWAQRSCPVAISLSDVARTLRELIVALDRRAPRAEHAGEAAIARDAAVLREKAVSRLAELADQATSSPDSPSGRVR